MQTFHSDNLYHRQHVDISRGRLQARGNIGLPDPTGMFVKDTTEFPGDEFDEFSRMICKIEATAAKKRLSSQAALGSNVQARPRSFHHISAVRELAQLAREDGMMKQSGHLGWPGKGKCSEEVMHSLFRFPECVCDEVPPGMEVKRKLPARLRLPLPDMENAYGDGWKGSRQTVKLFPASPCAFDGRKLSLKSDFSQVTYRSFDENNEEEDQLILREQTGMSRSEDGKNFVIESRKVAILSRESMEAAMGIRKLICMAARRRLSGVHENRSCDSSCFLSALDEHSHSVSSLHVTEMMVAFAMICHRRLGRETVLYSLTHRGGRGRDAGVMGKVVKGILEELQKMMTLHSDELPCSPNFQDVVAEDFNPHQDTSDNCTITSHDMNQAGCPLDVSASDLEPTVCRPLVAVDMRLMDSVDGYMASLTPLVEEEHPVREEKPLTLMTLSRTRKEKCRLIQCAYRRHAAKRLVESASMARQSNDRRSAAVFLQIKIFYALERRRKFVVHQEKCRIIILSFLRLAVAKRKFAAEYREKSLFKIFSSLQSIHHLHEENSSNQSAKSPQYAQGSDALHRICTIQRAIRSKSARDAFLQAKSARSKMIGVLLVRFLAASSARQVYEQMFLMRHLSCKAILIQNNFRVYSSRKKLILVKSVRFYERHEGARMDAATRIQGAFMSLLARRRVQQERKLRALMQGEGMQKRMMSCVKLQMAIRGFLARKDLQLRMKVAEIHEVVMQRMQMSQSAARIQQEWRRWQAQQQEEDSALRVSVDPSSMEERGALRIQRQWRGHRVREGVRSMWRKLACIRIQRAFRGHMARSRVRWLRVIVPAQHFLQQNSLTS